MRLAEAVAQTCSLLYRGLAVCKASNFRVGQTIGEPGRFQTCAAADYKSALLLRKLALVKDQSSDTSFHQKAIGMRSCSGRWTILTLMLGWAVTQATAPAAEIRVLAASSLTDSLRAIAAKYDAASGNRDKIILNFGASSTLARQIEEGAPADIFFSADESKMERLEQKGLIVKPSRKSFLSNQLVIVVAADGGAAVNSPGDLTKASVKRVALGDPKVVPIGIYAKEYLEKFGLWKKIQRKIVVTENVRAALAAVEAGNADASIVYKTDAGISHKVKIAYEVPREDGPKISYPVALVKADGRQRGAEEFLTYLTTPEALKVFENYGFVIASPP